ncbi:MAG: hemolysin III family protein [Acidobacteriota bacterium]|jgi:hemolysin III
MNHRERRKLKIIEEIVNSVTHGVGLGLAITGLVVLVTLSALYSSPWAVVGSSIYGATLVILYSASTVYHSLKKGRAKRFFRILDHVSIYLLIAGTYTPLTLVNLRGAWGWTLFGVIWGLAFLGIFLKTTLGHRIRVLSPILYLIMGWLAVVALHPLMLTVPHPGLVLLFAGGAAYTAGVIFFALDTKVPYFHGIWHLFVLAGSVLHFFAIMVAILPHGAL